MFVLLAATAAVLLFIYVRATPKYWRDTAGSLSAAGAPPPEWWSFSAGKWYGTRRAFAATTPLLIFGLAAFTLRDALGERSPYGDLLGWLMVIPLTLCFALNLSITLYNRPRVLAPPHLRGEPGSRARKREQRSRRRAA